MLSFKLSALLAPFFLGSLASAALRDGRAHGNMAPSPLVPRVTAPTEPLQSVNGSTLPPITTIYHFDQLIDHTNPSLGTFKQRYWHTWEWYKSGGPIIITTPGEGNADGYEGYLTNVTINGQIAQEANGATVVIEHRFYGLSNPFANLSVASLQYHTLPQATADLVYFAQTATLAMPGGDNVQPGKAPWILIGGSYAGALTAWTMASHPGVFWAGYASSAVVEAITDFWQYFEPIRQNMPANCSADVEAVITHVDQVFTNGTAAEISDLKSNWGLGSVTHLDDVAGALRNNLWDWQLLDPTTGPGSAFFNFCDALEVKSGQNAPASGWGLDNAVTAWGKYWNETYYEYLCDKADPQTCLGTYDSSEATFTNITVDNSARSWEWIVCNDVGFFQEGPPGDETAIVSRLVQPGYDERQCAYYFPEQFGNATTPAPNANATNAFYNGWDVKVDRLFIANGQRDPWRYATVSSGDVNITSTSTQPILVGDGYHCSDLGSSAGLVDPTVLHVQQESLKYMKTWLAEWTPSTNASSSATYNSAETSNGISSSPAPAVPAVIGGKAVNAWFRQFGSN
ncbi:peptidase S28 [Athelia psychrophila]|uniref:Peptidase S28 n=1 Tax=Athelia psychrophila TaxID=1759441 RepID=A0A167V2C3_9AGAM|nr:peptidase S28 [Fibularhizoctonia sp. CBS 109695]